MTEQLVLAGTISAAFVSSSVPLYFKVTEYATILYKALLLQYTLPLTMQAAAR
jgi:hypothetical protein